MDIEKVLEGFTAIPFDQHDMVGYIKTVDKALAEIKRRVAALNEDWEVVPCINLSFNEDWSTIYPNDETTPIDLDDRTKLFDEGNEMWKKVYERLDLNADIVTTCVRLMYHLEKHGRISEDYNEKVKDLEFFTVNWDT